MPVELNVDGHDVVVTREDASLLDVLREDLGCRSVKDGCSPQGQCGCCTVLVDGAPRVSCVTAVRRVAGRRVVTFDGLPAGRRDAIVDALVAHGGSQCGFCTPGIVCRAAALPPDAGPDAVERALLAHLCRCTGWRSVVDAVVDATVDAGGARPALADRSPADRSPADRRAAIEGRAPQVTGPEAAGGRGGFADDGAPADALVAVPAADGGWAVGETLAEARATAGRVPGRRSGRSVLPPLAVPAGDWDLVLATSWVEPAYLEPDASWCRPGGEPAPPGANGGAFGGKASSPTPAAARALADRHGRPVRVLLSREDVVRLTPKRPPLAVGLRLDGSGRLTVARTPGVGAVLAAALPGATVEEVDVVGPPTSVALRAAGWAEAAAVLAGLQVLGARALPSSLRVEASVAPAGADGRSAVVTVAGPDGGEATVTVTVDGTGRPVRVRARVDCGDPLDEVVARSYAAGAVHMGLSWVCSEGLAVDEDGTPVDLTIRSFGVLRAVDTPSIDVELVGTGAPVNGSESVMAATAAACWVAQGLPSGWPTRRGSWSGHDERRQLP